MDKFTESALENLPIGLMILDENSNITYMNNVLKTLLLSHGLEHNTIDDIRQCIDASIERERSKEEYLFNIVKRTAKPALNRNLSLKMPDGEYIFTTMNVYPVVEDNVFKGAVFYITQITGSSTFTEGQLLFETDYKGIFNNLPVAIWEEDYSEVKRELNVLENMGISDIREYCRQYPEFPRQMAAKVKIINANKTAHDMYEIGDQNSITRIGPLFTQQSYNGFINRLECILLNRDTVKYTDVNLTTGGRMLDVLVTMIRLSGANDDCSRVLIIDSDISEQKKYEDKLTSERNYWKGLLDAAPFTIWKSDKDGNTVWMNENWYLNAGAERDEANTELWKNFMHEDDYKSYSEMYSNALKHKTSYVTEHRVRNKEGHYKWILEFAEPVYSRNGDFDGHIAFCVDITHRKMLEQSEKQANDLLLEMYSTASELTKTLEFGKIINIICNFVNRIIPGTSLLISQYKRTSSALDYIACYKNHELCNPDEMNRIKSGRIENDSERTVIEENKFIIMSGAPSGFESVNGKETLMVPLKINNKVAGIIYIISSEEGRFTADRISVIEAVLYNIIMAIRNAQLYTQTLEDAAKRESIQNEMLQLQKMEAIGRLAGGIAHDFNNILTVISGFTQIMQMELNPGDRFYDEIAGIADATDKASTISQQLLLVSRKHPLRLENRDLNEIVSGILPMLGRIIGEDVRLISDFAGYDLVINADKSRIEQVIMNIVVNARDAMPDGGNLYIRTEKTSFSRVAVSENPELTRTGPFAMLSIRDTGIGIEPELRNRIFEPFFTTKDNEKGTGLGLSTVYNIVKLHNGWIDMHSESDVGTEFRIFIPLSGSIQSEKDYTEIRNADYKGKNELILIVEDEYQILSLLKGILKDAGYRVVAAQNAQEAYQLYIREKNNIKLVFSDIVLPDSTGVELVKLIREDNPNMKVIMASGYADKKKELDFIAEQGIKFLSKPYKLIELLKAVSETLNSNP